MKKNKLIINTDGGAVPNPGPARIGAIIKDEQGKVIASISKSIGQTTNNQAEYQAIITALEKAISLGATEVEIRTDSELVTKQINGQYRVKEESLKQLYQRVKQLQSRFQVFTIVHIPNTENKEAHNLASQH